MDDVPDNLIDRAVERLAPPAPSAGLDLAAVVDWRLAGALAGLIALGPLLTIVGAGVLERGVRAEAERLRPAVTSKQSATAIDRGARDMLRLAVREAPVAVWLDRAAAALPTEARVSRMARAADGQIEIDITAPDPDLVRGAMRRDRAFAAFREVGQRRAGAMILITYRRAA